MIDALDLASDPLPVKQLAECFKNPFGGAVVSDLNSIQIAGKLRLRKELFMKSKSFARPNSSPRSRGCAHLSPTSRRG
jgi:hypothetical protein